MKSSPFSPPVITICRGISPLISTPECSWVVLLFLPCYRQVLLDFGNGFALDFPFWFCISFAQLLLRTVTTESKLTNSRSLVLFDCLRSGKRYNQIVSDYHFHTLSITSHQGGGCHRKGGGVLSGLNDKPDTDGHWSPFRIPVRVSKRYFKLGCNE